MTGASQSSKDLQTAQSQVIVEVDGGVMLASLWTGGMNHLGWTPKYVLYMFFISVFLGTSTAYGCLWSFEVSYLLDNRDF